MTPAQAYKHLTNIAYAPGAGFANPFTDVKNFRRKTFWRPGSFQEAWEASTDPITRAAVATATRYYRDRVRAETGRDPRFLTNRYEDALAEDRKRNGEPDPDPKLPAGTFDIDKLVTTVVLTRQDVARMTL